MIQYGARKVNQRTGPEAVVKGDAASFSATRDTDAMCRKPTACDLARNPVVISGCGLT